MICWWKRVGYRGGGGTRRRLAPASLQELASRCFHCLAADQSGGEGDGERQRRGKDECSANSAPPPPSSGGASGPPSFSERSPNLIRSQRAYLFSWLKSSGTRFPQERKRTLFTEGQGQSFKASCLEDALSAELRYTLALGRSQPTSGGQTGQSQHAYKMDGDVQPLHATQKNRLLKDVCKNHY